MNQPKSILAVCDLEVEYAYNFMEYLNQKRNIPFDVQAFTGPEVLCAYAQNHSIEILLISGKAMCDAIKEINVGMLIILRREFTTLILINIQVFTSINPLTAL